MIKTEEEKIEEKISEEIPVHLVQDSVVISDKEVMEHDYLELEVK
jgi:hypothetical protein